MLQGFSSDESGALDDEDDEDEEDEDEVGTATDPRRDCGSRGKRRATASMIFLSSTC